jgi:hypothetical protein
MTRKHINMKLSEFCCKSAYQVVAIGDTEKFEGIAQKTSPTTSNVYFCVILLMGHKPYDNQVKTMATDWSNSLLFSNLL